MGDLTTWVKENSPYVRLKDGESMTGKYMGFSTVQDTFNPLKEKIRYHIEVDGKMKFFDSGSSRLALVFDEIEKGKLITLTSEGE